VTYQSSVVSQREWRYVHRLCHSDLLTLKGHTGGVRSASFSPDGSRVMTGSFDQTAKVWDAKSGAEVLSLWHITGVSSASFSPDSSQVLTGSADKTAKVWDAKSGAEVFSLKGHTSGVSSASFSPDGSRVVTRSLALVTMSDDNAEAAQVWDARPFKP
jgi:eukaryotic-like serine/threonine-protein kinase